MADLGRLSRDVTPDAEPFTSADQAAASQLTTEASCEGSAVNENPRALDLADSDGDIEKYRCKFPKNLRVDYYDAMILYHDNDRPAALSFVERVKKELSSSKTPSPSIALYDEVLPEPGISPVGVIDLILPYCSYVFLFITKEFFEDDLFEFSSSTCIMNSILKPHQKWSVVPIFTEPKKCLDNVPASVLSLRGLQYSCETGGSDLQRLGKMFEHKFNTRQQNEKELEQRRRDWIRKEKKREKEKIEEKSEKDTLAENSAAVSSRWIRQAQPTTCVKGKEADVDENLQQNFSAGSGPCESESCGAETVPQFRTPPGTKDREAQSTAAFMKKHNASGISQNGAKADSTSEMPGHCLPGRTQDQTRHHSDQGCQTVVYEHPHNGQINLGSAGTVYIAENIYIQHKITEPKTEWYEQPQ